MRRTETLGEGESLLVDRRRILLLMRACVCVRWRVERKMSGVLAHVEAETRRPRLAAWRLYFAPQSDRQFATEPQRRTTCTRRRDRSPDGTRKSDNGFVCHTLWPLSRCQSNSSKEHLHYASKALSGRSLGTADGFNRGDTRCGERSASRQSSRLYFFLEPCDFIKRCVSATNRAFASDLV